MCSICHSSGSTEKRPCIVWQALAHGALRSLEPRTTAAMNQPPWHRSRLLQKHEDEPDDRLDSHKTRYQRVTLFTEAIELFSVAAEPFSALTSIVQ